MKRLLEGLEEFCKTINDNVDPQTFIKKIAMKAPEADFIDSADILPVQPAAWTF
jgi:hypothetical protein